MCFRVNDLEPRVQRGFAHDVGIGEREYVAGMRRSVGEDRLKGGLAISRGDWSATVSRPLRTLTGSELPKVTIVMENRLSGELPTACHIAGGPDYGNWKLGFGNCGYCT